MSSHPASADNIHAPKVIKKVVGSDVEQFVQLVRAAATIGLGVELTNAFKPAPQGGYSEEWSITLYSEPAGRARPEG
ncbi:hypothetical protein [Nonomuraea rhodomycinica]|uniref:Uncharacterized protein n=1 Tax=Nonomuraea rhodomycinica TaxID=1712872 RepID=A0A7Y6IT08_9ACTN|nr:hypothetical protein [Nonomuraea rhodomycinica]NUW43630.1 hypothetical protein [Nonomuraea rhodomycinica]